ncbi:hypothetical protein Vafri_12418, partial [Volvox africanus]
AMPSPRSITATPPLLPRCRCTVPVAAGNITPPSKVSVIVPSTPTSMSPPPNVAAIRAALSLSCVAAADISTRSPRPSSIVRSVRRVMCSSRLPFMARLTGTCKRSTSQP